jgi:hypothetical protein
MKISLTLCLLITLVQISLSQRGDVEEQFEPGSNGAHRMNKDCEDGFFHDLSSDSCLQCHPICKTCAGFKLNCLSCAEGYNFDPLVKTHCLKEGWTNKFHHLDELVQHLIPQNIKSLGLHVLFRPSGMIMYIFIFLVFVVVGGTSYLCAWYYYRRTRGININEMYLQDVIDMILGRDIT